ncbi:MAG TPA: alpha/beta hydrolase [Thermomicrobiales bacterium]|nr:alpha/beta hydrolase [Thermomicrobiales bacterium]
MEIASRTGSLAARHHRITGGAGIDLNVAETGNENGRPVLFIHGLSQCGLAWRKQLFSDLADDLRLVAMDLRGHGQSERPPDGYDDQARWAEDVHTVITTLGLERPILCGWSYGGVVIGDYIRRYGELAIGGICLVGAVSQLGESVMPFLGEKFIATFPGLFSDEVEASITALKEFIGITTNSAPTIDDLYFTLGYNGVVPPYVRRALLSRTLNHEDVFQRLGVPVLIAHGLDDEIVLPTMSERHASLMPHAKTSYYDSIGHAPFFENPGRFNSELLAFSSTL